MDDEPATAPDDAPPPRPRRVRVLNDHGWFVYVPVDNAPQWDERRWRHRPR